MLSIIAGGNSKLYQFVERMVEVVICASVLRVMAALQRRNIDLLSYEKHAAIKCLDD